MDEEEFNRLPKDAKGFLVPSSGPEKYHYIVMAKCCRLWPVSPISPMGHCGYCGEKPKIL